MLKAYQTLPTSALGKYPSEYFSTIIISNNFYRRESVLLKA